MYLVSSLTNSNKPLSAHDKLVMSSVLPWALIDDDVEDKTSQNKQILR